MKDVPCSKSRAAWWGILGFLLLALLLGGCSSGSSAANWQGLGLRGKQVKSLAFGPVNSHTILAGTSGQGLFRSLDDGATWAADTTGLPSGLTVNSIVLDASQGILYLGTDQGVFQSDDDGDHWTGSSRGLPSGAAGVVTALLFTIMDATLYAGTAGAGIFVSHDGAKTWSASGKGLPADAAVHALLAGRQEHNPHLYAALAGAGVYRSSDGGQNWSASNTGLPPGVDGLSLLSQPSGPGGLYLGTSVGVYRSMDNGRTWQAVNTDLGDTSPTVYALALNDENPTILFAGTGTGVYVSSDGGAHWGQVAGGLPSGQGVMAIAVQGSASSFGLLYIGVDNVYRYPSQAASTGSHVIEGIIIAVLVIVLLLLFYQQRRMMRRLMPTPPARSEAPRPEAPRRERSADSMLAQRRAEMLRASAQSQTAEPAGPTDEPGRDGAGAESKEPS